MPVYVCCLGDGGGRLGMGCMRALGPSTNRLVEQQRLANVFDFGNGALEVKGFGKHDFEDLESFFGGKSVLCVSFIFSIQALGSIERDRAKKGENKEN